MVIPGLRQLSDYCQSEVNTFRVANPNNHIRLNLFPRFSALTASCTWLHRLRLAWGTSKHWTLYTGTSQQGNKFLLCHLASPEAYFMSSTIWFGSSTNTWVKQLEISERWRTYVYSVRDCAVGRCLQYGGTKMDGNIRLLVSIENTIRHITFILRTYYFNFLLIIHPFFFLPRIYYCRGAHFFQKCRSHLKILGAGNFT